MDMKRRWVPSILFSFGLVLLGSFLLEIFLRIFGAAPLSGPFVASVSTSLPFALVLLGGGFSLSRDTVPEEYYPHISLGTLAGAVFFGVFFSIIAVVLFAAWIDRVGVLRWGVTVGAGNGFLVSYLYARGLSQEVELERQAIHAEEADRQQRLLTYLNALLRHEVLNAATAINAHAELADEVAKEDEVHERVEVIQRQTDGMTSVIDDVQVLLAVTEDRADLRALNLTPPLQEEIRTLKDRYPSVTTELELPEEVYVRGDDLLGRLFANLLENAVEHNEGCPPQVSVTATQSAETVEIAVADNGPGFPTENINDLFDPLERMDTTHGLGLAIVTQLAERYGGSVELTETGEEGSTVTVTLPQPDSEPERSVISSVSG